MKKLMIALILLPFVGFTQTTLEEYNFVTKGLKIQKESGLDMKKGYVLKEIKDIRCNGVMDEINREIKLFKLVKTATNKEACLVLEWQRAGQEKNYYCIPHEKSTEEIWKLWVVDIQAMNSASASYCLFNALWTLRGIENPNR